MKLIERYRADVWDRGNTLTQFYECVYECPLCKGEKKVTGRDIIGYSGDFDLDWEYEKAFKGEDGDIDENKEGDCPLCLGEGKITIYE